mgnify:CR=1 FL=1
MSEFEVFEGRITEIIYSNCTNGYTVCVVENDDETITATGCMPYLAENDDVKLSGKWVTHPEYGRQFSVKGFEKTMPSESGAILKYLSSGVIKGVRLATAKKIVDAFGDDTLNIIMTSPERLSEIKGISYEKALEIGEDYSFKQGTQSIIMFLQNYGIGSVLAMKIYRRFGSDAVSKIKENPYVLANEISGISFRSADKIAFSLGVRADDNERIKAGIIYVLNENAHNLGHTYLPKDELVNQVAGVLGVEILQAENALAMLLGEAKVYLQNVRGEEAVFLENMLFSESLISRKLLGLVCDDALMREDEVLKFISKWEKENGTELADEQKNAVFLAAKSGAVVITGGPGTGKTTVINAIIDMFEKSGLKVAVTAPTGRAAKRLSEVTKREAKTIHRLLEVGFADDDDIRDFSHKETNPLEQDAFIVDEASMIDVSLGSALLRAVKLSARVIFVGDADQLPSVGAGNMLSDIINSKKVPVVRLNVIFRQAEKSMIVRNAHRVIDGLMPLANQEGTDFFFIGKDNIEEARETVCRLCDTRIPKAYGFDPVENIQILCPTRKTEVGTIALNVALQRTLNPFSRDKNEYKSGNVIFREGDRIMHTKNNYDIEWESISGTECGMGVFNGDMGFVEKIDIENRSLYAVYDDKRVMYDLSMLDEIEHCYAITVHKSQGSEFDVVIMPVYGMSPFLMRRNLFYTAITRAKSIVILVGKMDTVAKMVLNNSDSLRYTSLKWRLENS